MLGKLGKKAIKVINSVNPYKSRIDSYKKGASDTAKVFLELIGQMEDEYDGKINDLNKENKKIKKRMKKNNKKSEKALYKMNNSNDLLKSIIKDQGSVIERYIKKNEDTKEDS